MVLRVQGPMTISERDFGIRRAIRAALDDGSRAFVIDLEALTVIDSSGVAEIAASHTTVANRGGRLAICNVSNKLKDIFIITRLNTVFETYDSEAEAIGALSAQV